MKSVFVTGPDGVLGSNLVRELLARDYQVTAMIQPGRTPITLDGLPIRTVACDLLDLNALRKASEGCDYLIHVAALTAVWPSRDPRQHRVNVVGTENIIQVALEHRVERLIHVGSASSFGFGTKAQPGTEDDPCKSAKYGLDYIDTKLEGQNRVLQAVQEKGLPAVVVNPTFMIGPYDSTPSSGAMIIALASGKVPGYTPGGKNWVHVRDVAVGICQALEKGRIGESYILGHQNLSFQEAFTIMAQAMGKRPPRMGLPAFLVKFSGRLGSLWGSLTGKAPKVSYPMAWIACDGHYFSPDKAVKELGLPQTGLEQAAKEAHTWFVEHQYIKA